MSKYFKVNFTFTETVETEATVEGNSPDDVVDKLRNYFAGTVENLVIHDVTELEAVPQPKGKPDLRIVN